MRKLFFVFAVAMLFSNVALAQNLNRNQPVWQQRSIYRNILVVEGDGHRCLTFGRQSSRQSCIEIEQPLKLVFGYTQSIFAAINELPHVGRVLVIGVGGGTLPMAIREKYPSAMIDAVELDPEVINVAERYFYFKPDDHISVYAEDGRVFVRKAKRRGWKYDAVILDAFDKDYIPEHMATAEFLAQVKAVLDDHGILLANTFSGTSYQKYEEATYQAVFGNIYEAVIPNGNLIVRNRIILAGRSAESVASRLPKSSLVEKSRALVLTDKFSPVNALLTR